MIALGVENELTQKEFDEYIMESSREGIGTIVKLKGQIVFHEWQNQDYLSDYVERILESEELKSSIDYDFSHAEVKFMYSFENYVKYLYDRGVEYEQAII